VLPFTNFSSDPDQQFFADGITDDLTTALSATPNSVVISRNTASISRYKPIDTKQIGRELGIRYVVEGGVHRWGNYVRVNARLIDAATDSCGPYRSRVMRKIHPRCNTTSQDGSTLRSIQSCSPPRPRG
jgi:TolB-like protein